MRKKKGKNALRMLALVSQLGICMLVCIFICVFLGEYLSRKLHQELIFPLMLVVGILAGMRSCYRMIQIFCREKEWKNHETDKMDKGNQ